MPVNNMLIIIRRKSCPQKRRILKVTLFTFGKYWIYRGIEDMPVNKSTVIKVISREFSTSYPHNVDNFM